MSVVTFTQVKGKVGEAILCRGRHRCLPLMGYTGVSYILSSIWRVWSDLTSDFPDTVIVVHVPTQHQLTLVSVQGESGAVLLFRLSYWVTLCYVGGAQQMNILCVYPGTGSSYILKMESNAACKMKYLKASYSPKKKITTLHNME